MSPATGEDFTYRLTGSGEEPLATDHVTVACKAHEKLNQSFSVVNRTKSEVVYSVESDLPHVSVSN